LRVLNSKNLIQLFTSTPNQLKYYPMLKASTPHLSSVLPYTSV
jgi:hypothetical protein